MINPGKPTAKDRRGHTFYESEKELFID